MTIEIGSQVIIEGHPSRSFEVVGSYSQKTVTIGWIVDTRGIDVGWKTMSNDDFMDSLNVTCTLAKPWLYSKDPLLHIPADHVTKLKIQIGDFIQHRNFVESGRSYEVIGEITLPSVPSFDALLIRVPNSRGLPPRDFKSLGYKLNVASVYMDCTDIGHLLRDSAVLMNRPSAGVATKISTPHVTLRCTTCDEPAPYAEANTACGKFQCWGCRQTWRRIA